MLLMLKLLRLLQVAGYCNYFLDNFPEENVGVCIYRCKYISVHTHVCMYIYIDT